MKWLSLIFVFVLASCGKQDPLGALTNADLKNISEVAYACFGIANTAAEDPHDKMSDDYSLDAIRLLTLSDAVNWKRACGGDIYETMGCVMGVSTSGAYVDKKYPSYEPLSSNMINSYCPTLSAEQHKAKDKCKASKEKMDSRTAVARGSLINSPSTRARFAGESEVDLAREIYSQLNCDSLVSNYSALIDSMFDKPLKYHLSDAAEKGYKY